jgi:hypothetical protein
MECGVGPHSKPSIYKQFCEAGCLFKGKVPSATKCMGGTGIPTGCEQSYQQCKYRKPLRGKINSDNCSLMFKCSDVASCLIDAKYISEIVNLTCAHPVFQMW